MIPSPSSCLLVGSLLLLAGCSSAPRETAQAPATETPARPRSENKQNLRKGMSESEIRSVWGDPKAVHTDKEGETILVYEFDVQTSQKLVATTMVEVPFVDPVSGISKMVMEPVLTPQSVTLTQTIVLQLREGRLASWARQLGEQRSFN